MATKGDPKNKGAAQRAKFRPQAEFVRFVLSDDEKALIKAHEYTLDDFVSDIQELTEEGYKVTFRWDDYGDCSGCWLVAPDDHEDNKGLILAGRGSTSSKAFKQAVYMHKQVYGGLWPHNVTKAGVDIDD